eukprot:3941387-Rhodomonas_salina.1
MSGMELAYGAVSLCACYAKTGTDLAYGATTGFLKDEVIGKNLVYSRAMSGTDTAHAVPAYALDTRCPVLTQHMLP